MNANPVIKKALEFVSKGKVLDVGAGSGEDSVFLALKNFEVEAVESNLNSIHDINQMMRINNVNIKTQNGNFLELEFERKNIVIMNNVLHLTDSEKMIDP